MATQDLSASVAGAASSSGTLLTKWGLNASISGECNASGDLSLSKTGLKATAYGAAFARASLCSKFALGAAQSSAFSMSQAELGVQRSRFLENDACEFFMIEADGSSRGAELLKFNARWQRHVAGDADATEWTEGKNITMSSSPTIIVNTGAPITSSTTPKLWIDACSYDASVVWPVSGVKNQIIEANFSGQTPGFLLTSTVENAEVTPTSYTWTIPPRVHTAQYEGKNRFEVRLADESNTRGLRLGYAFHIKSELVRSAQSGWYATDFYFTIPEALVWHLAIDYYIKTSCDFDDPAQERNVAYIHRDVDLTTSVFNKNVEALKLIHTDYQGTIPYMNMVQHNMDLAMERHVAELWKQIDNFVSPEEEWQMYPIRLNDISMRISKRNSRIEFQLANQYPVLTYVDAFADRTLALFLDSESPATISQSYSATPI